MKEDIQSVRSLQYTLRRIFGSTDGI
ncbi:hypothetical protein R3I93_013014 [Phoxinus phoxinus]|uniref:Uncharacterized protein n=1 Tax=Phoxinus phoxinus TaxID=58324 RepID=A0AAN9H2X0_9TELE